MNEILMDGQNFMKLNRKELISYCLSEVMKNNFTPTNKSQRERFNKIAEDANLLVDFLVENGFLEHTKELNWAIYDYCDIIFLSEILDHK